MKKYTIFFIILLAMNLYLAGQCPSNMITEGENLIKNGDFNLGNRFFVSDYKFKRDFKFLGWLKPGEYSIHMNPFYANPEFKECMGWQKNVDDSKLIIDGDDKVGAVVWGQTVKVKPNSTYTISFFVATLRNLGFDPISFDVKINGKLVGSVEHSQLKTCNWTEYHYSWRSMNTKNAKIEIINTFEQGNEGNDYILDDIAMFECKKQTLSDLTKLLAESVTYEEKPIVVAKVDPKDNEPASIKDQIEQHTKGSLEAVRLDNVFFESGKSTLKPESFKELDLLASIMNIDRKDMKIEISGHTDNVGSKDANMNLSRSRARSVLTYLLKKKVAYARMKAIGYGDTKPVASNDTEEGRQQNRRVEFKILK